MWIVYSVLSAFFAGITSIFAKCGIKKTDSDIATVVRTFIVLIFAWAMAFFSGGISEISNLDIKTMLFLIISGAATGFSWLFYFKALQLGDINKVVPIDKSSVALTMIFAFIFLGEFSFAKLFLMIILLIGTLLMVSPEKKSSTKNSKELKNNKWFLYAIFSAIFAAASSILAKIGIVSVNSDLGTAIRTSVVLVMSVAIVFFKGKDSELKNIEKKELIFLFLSGVATGFSWIFYYRALSTGPVSVIVPIDKLSILFTVAFSFIVFKEKLSVKSLLGLFLIVLSTVVLVFA